MIIPSIHQLREFVTKIDQLYPKQQNSQRVSFINMLKRLEVTTRDCSDELAAEILLGFCLLEIAIIRESYAYLSPERSDLYRLLRKELNIEKEGAISDAEILIHLSTFYTFAKTLEEDFPQSTSWKCKQSLLDNVKHIVEEILKRHSKIIKQLLAEPPSYFKLRENLSAVVHDYKQEASFFGKNQKRNELQQLIDIINKSCDKLYPKDSEHLANTEYLPSYVARMGVALLGMKTIENEYKLRNPDNSQLYCLLRDAIHLKDTSYMCNDKKLFLLSSLLTHIDRLLETPQELINWGKKAGYPHTEKICLHARKTIAAEIRDIAAINASETTSRLPNSFANASKTAAQCGFELVLIKSLDLIPTILIDGAAGAAGFVFFGPTGAVVATQLAHLSKNNLITPAMAYLFGNIFEKIGYSLGSAAVNLVALPVSFTTEGVKQLLNLYAAIAPEKDEMLMALVQLHSDLYSPEKKEILEDTQKIHHQAFQL